MISLAIIRQVGGRGTLCSPGLREVLRQGRCPTPSAPDTMEPHSRLRGMKWDWWRDWAGFTRQEETGRCSLAPLAPPQQCRLHRMPVLRLHPAWKAPPPGPEQPAPTGQSRHLLCIP